MIFTILKFIEIFRNPLLPCEQLPTMDLSFWREQPNLLHPEQQLHGPSSFYDYLPGYVGK